MLITNKSNCINVVGFDELQRHLERLRRDGFHVHGVSRDSESFTIRFRTAGVLCQVKDTRGYYAKFA